MRASRLNGPGVQSLIFMAKPARWTFYRMLLVLAATSLSQRHGLTRFGKRTFESEANREKASTLKNKENPSPRSRSRSRSISHRPSPTRSPWRPGVDSSRYGNSIRERKKNRPDEPCPSWRGKTTESLRYSQVAMSRRLFHGFHSERAQTHATEGSALSPTRNSVHLSPRVCRSREVARVARNATEPGKLSSPFTFGDVRALPSDDVFKASVAPTLRPGGARY
jgi:hypothetical protein